MTPDTHRWLLALVSALTVSACAIHTLSPDRASDFANPAAEEDGVTVVFLPAVDMTPVPTGDRVKVVPMHGIVAVLGKRTDARRPGGLDSIEVLESVIDIREVDGHKRLELSTWRRHTVDNEVHYTAELTSDLEVNFSRLTEIQLSVKFTGVYANGDRREYVVQRRVKPRATYRNPTDFLPRA